MLLPTGVIGVLNLYARHRDAFGSASRALGEAFARPAAVAVSNAQELAHAEQTIAQLRDALLSRAEIDQAIGIVRSRTGGSSEEAFALLRDESQIRSLKLKEIARDLLADAVQRAPGA